MKNILKILSVFIASGILLFSCEEIETNFASLTDAPDLNATYYLQFVDAAQSFETGISESGELVEVETTIAVALMGMPSNQDIVVDFAIDPSTTIEPDMYTLSATSITIPAGSTSGSVILKTIAENMPVGDELKFVLNMDAGEHNSPNANGLKIDYDIKRLKFCSWTVDDMVGTYTGSEYNGWGYDLVGGAKFEVFKIDDTHIAISGFWQAMYGPNYWGETVTDGDRPVFTYKANGKLEFENQYAVQTEGKWNYYIGPGGGDAKWDGCNFSFTIPYYAHWDDDYGDNVPCLVEMTLDGTKSARITDVPVFDKKYEVKKK